VILSAEKIFKSFGNLQVLKGIDLSINKKEIVSIVGASGAGKSTLLHILGTLDKPDSGKLCLIEKNLEELQSNQLAHFRNSHIGFIFQFHNLLPEFTALENICIPGYIGGKVKDEVEKEGKELLKILGILDREDHKPSELSGGEQQRVSVARALINKPDIVFADEPSGNLDSKNANELHNLIFELRDNLDQTFVIATHNHELSQMADRQFSIIDGKLV